MKSTIILFATFYVSCNYAIGGLFLTKRQVQPDSGTSISCPANWDPSPCVCEATSTKPTVTCNNATSGDDIKQAFAKLNENVAFGTFWLRGTPVTTLPASVFGKGSFDSIFASDNQLETVDDDAFKGSEDTVENFLLERNNFATFNFNALKSLKNLHNFELSGDKLSSIPDDAFGEQLHLEVVNFNDNNIQTLGKNVFAKMPKLRTIDLSRNNLTTLQDFSFSTPDTVNAISLLLGHNQISTISNNAFKDLKVKSLEAEDNKLESLDQTVFSSVVESINDNNGHMSTLGNPFNCENESVKWILQLPAQKRGKIIGFMCRDGRALQQLQLTE